MRENRYARFGISKADILLPKEGIDLEKWAVVACDQYTSEKEYWKKVEEFVADEPSTLHLILPECYLEESDKERRIENINSMMEYYLHSGIFHEWKDSFILVKRTMDGKVRYGLMAALDLECYDYGKDSKSLVRATEGTILSRIPPRMEIRRNATLELPHIVVLISDEKRSVIEPLLQLKNKKIYETELMMDGGHLEGYLVNDEGEDIIYSALEKLYENLDQKNPLLYAMGDGNHSLATAKALWEETKRGLSAKEKEGNPMRYALVEIENIYDDGITFEPIHRVFFNESKEHFAGMLGRKFKSTWIEKVDSREELQRRINEGGNVRMGLADGNGMYVLELTGGDKTDSAKIVQDFIDGEKPEVDYIHGLDATLKLSKEGKNLGIIMPDVSKDTFFSTIIRDGSFPRKTFSIGESNEKRYYMEARLIVNALYK